jgi:2-C-methyl-D-erythritol 4-phosphate cytidylyltransferase/2-C-methyl-D-erythritol 2,4-cyclodiphosphate synthase
MTETVALIVAAGRGHRAGGGLPKQFRMLAGQSMLRRSCLAFIGHARVDRVRTVIHPDDMEFYVEAAAGLELMSPIPGGATRQESVRNGLESLATISPRYVLIHDAARPLVDSRTIELVLEALTDAPAALAAIPVTDTLKKAAPDGTVFDTVAREGLWRAQTPQGFRYDDILEAHRSLAGESLTDDATVAEAAGLRVVLTPGTEDNFKITTEDDFARAERMLGEGDIRVGNGFDVHRLGEGDHVTLCGVKIGFGKGLLGHSDADVGLHALTDALLGAIGDGDIGSHFPPSDPQWKGIDSSIFLRHAAELVSGRGGEIRHLDVTLVCEEPKIGPHREAMRSRVAEIAGVDLGRVSVKATTTEHLGFAGRGEGIAAQATATVRL